MALSTEKASTPNQRPRPCGVPNAWLSYAWWLLLRSLVVDCSGQSLVSAVICQHCEVLRISVPSCKLWWCCWIALNGKCITNVSVNSFLTNHWSIRWFWPAWRFRNPTSHALTPTAIVFLLVLLTILMILIRILCRCFPPVMGSHFFLSISLLWLPKAAYTLHDWSSDCCTVLTRLSSSQVSWSHCCFHTTGLMIHKEESQTSLSVWSPNCV